MSAIYLIGSLRNPCIPQVAKALRDAGHIVFDDWYAAGPTADDSWKEYEKNRGNDFPTALNNWAAGHVFDFDKTHLDRSDVAVLVLPAGRSAHIELGYIVGKGKRGFVLLEGDPDRWDVMYKFATGVCPTLESLLDAVAQ